MPALLSRVEIDHLLLEPLGEDLLENIILGRFSSTCRFLAFVLRASINLIIQGGIGCCYLKLSYIFQMAF